ncbi:MAG: hypothetical protein JXA53_02905 [Bacteroidales bacterium]|nr:hypothetical protein [Bacteroidales bacterium]
MKRPGFNNEKLKRKHKISMLFNDAEIEAIEKYCEKYNITNRSKFMREAIISEVLQKFDNDYPKLFNY